MQYRTKPLARSVIRVEDASLMEKEMNMTLSVIEYLYRPMYRPAHNSAFPPDVTWDYVEAPATDPIIAVRRGLPLSRQPFGVIALNRRLTSQERTEYQMEIV